MKSALALILLLLSFSSWATQYGDFVLTHEPGDGNIFCAESSLYGRGCGYLSTEARERPEKTQTLSFIFYSPDFFVENNQGHFGVGLRAHSVFPNGDITKIEARGRGIVFGNLIGYQNTAPGCGTTRTNNTITFETWWFDGEQKNCVMGWNESVPLENGQYYRLTVSSTRENGMYVSYVLQKYSSGLGWVVADRSSVYDFTPASGNTDGGLFISHVFSEHPWTFYIWDLREEWH